MPNKIHSKAQMRQMFALEGRGELPAGKAEEMAHAEGYKRLSRLPEYAHEAAGGLMHHLLRRYFGGGEAGEHHHGYEHDEKRGDYVDPDGGDGHEECQHFSHGGVSAEHHPACPMYGGGFAEEEDEDVDEPEEDFEADMRREVGVPERAVHYAFGSRPGPRAAMPPLHERSFRMALGGEAEEDLQHLQGEGWQDDERNRARSPLAARLSGGRYDKSFRKVLRRPATRVP